MYFLDLLASVDVYFVFSFYLFDISEIFLCRQKKKPRKLKKKKKKKKKKINTCYDSISNRICSEISWLRC